MCDREFPPYFAVSVHRGLKNIHIYIYAFMTFLSRFFPKAFPRRLNPLSTITPSSSFYIFPWNLATETGPLVNIASLSQGTLHTVALLTFFTTMCNPEQHQQHKFRLLWDRPHREGQWSHEKPTFGAQGISNARLHRHSERGQCVFVLSELGVGGGGKTPPKPIGQSVGVWFPCAVAAPAAERGASSVLTTQEAFHTPNTNRPRRRWRPP